MTVIPKSSSTRITSQQQAVYQAVKKATQHSTAEQVYKEVSKTLPRISVATVYRNLDKLADSNLISKVIIKGLAYFELETQPHYHLICQSCRRLDNLDIPPVGDIEDYFSRSTPYKLTGHDLVLYGICPVCQKNK